MIKTPNRFHNIFFRVASTFAILILVFAVLLGVIFIRMYTSSTEEYNRNELEKIAQNAAMQFRVFVLEDEVVECMQYLATFGELEGAELWSVTNSMAQYPMPASFESIDHSVISAQAEYAELLEKAFDGNCATETFYSNIHEATAMVASVPVIGNEREICGALLIVRSMEQMDETISNCQQMIIISSLLALVISAAVAAWLAGRITDPIKQMRTMAREMTEGNYDCKTGIDRTDEIGEMARSIDTLSDRLKENEVERANLEQMRLDFFANVSHELRTPIAVVRGTTECLADGVVTDPVRVSEYYERILRECKSMERLVADLLTLSKMQNPNFKVEKEPVNLVHIFDELIRSANAISAEKNIKIVMNREKDVYMMMGDYDRLRQMFMVIFDNAIKFSHENSNIYVTISSGERLTVSIRDEGIGISEEELPYIFDKFYKSKLRQNAKGTGLGLAIAKYVALKHDGEIEVKSKVGEGTEFIFYFCEISEEEYLLSETSREKE